MKASDHTAPAGDLTRTAALECRPQKNSQVTQERLDSGDLLLSYPVAVRPWLARWLKRLGGPEPPVRVKKLQLDALGTTVWELMDGRRTVRQMIREFAAIQKLHPREAEVSITLFLRQLGRRGIIGLK